MIFKYELWVVEDITKKANHQRARLYFELLLIALPTSF